MRQGLAEMYTLTQLNRWNVGRGPARASAARAWSPTSPSCSATSPCATPARSPTTSSAPRGCCGAPTALSGGVVQELTVFSPGPSIYGGSDQIQRNIISERGLGLPKEPGDFRTVAFKDLPKNV